MDQAIREHGKAQRRSPVASRPMQESIEHEHEHEYEYGDDYGVRYRDEELIYCSGYR